VNRSSTDRHHNGSVRHNEEDKVRVLLMKNQGAPVTLDGVRIMEAKSNADRNPAGPDAPTQASDDEWLEP
jgi:hypothetical protein